MAVGAAIKLLLSLAYLAPGELHFALPVLPKAELALEIAPALFGVGISSATGRQPCASPALISAIVITPLIAWMGAHLAAPLYPRPRLVSEMDAGDIWSRYVRYIGAGAVATAGIITVLRGLPTMVGAPSARWHAASAAAALLAAGTDRTDRDLPGRSCSAASRSWC